MTRLDHLQALKRLEPFNAGDDWNYRGLKSTGLKGSGKEAALVCSEPGQVFKVELPNLTEPFKDLDTQQALDTIQEALKSSPAFREFAWYSPSLIGRLTTGQEAQPQRDAAVRLRLMDLLIAALEGREGYQTTRWLLLRQRFVFLAGLAVLGDGWLEEFRGRYVRVFDHQVRRAQRMWAETLIANQDQVSLLLADYPALDVEDEGRRLVLDGDRLWPFCTRDHHDRTFVDHVLRQWFLRRYDLATVSQVTRLTLSSRWPVWSRRGVEAGAALIVAALLVRSATLIWLGLLLATIPVTANLLLIRRSRMGLYPLVLRLPATAVVGLAAMMGLVDPLTHFTFSALEHPIAATVIMILALSAAFGYIFSEVFSRLGDLHLTLRRGLLLWRYGWACAVLLATVGAWLAEPVGLADCTTLARQVPICGGCISVDYVLITSTLALFVGVFVQIFWEDKAISEPL